MSGISRCPPCTGHSELSSPRPGDPVRGRALLARSARRPGRGRRRPPQARSQHLDRFGPGRCYLVRPGQILACRSVRYSRACWPVAACPSGPRVEQRRHRARGDLGPILLGSRNIPREDRGDVGSNRIAPGEGWPEGEALPERPYQGRVAVLLGHDGLRVDVAEMASIGMRTPDRSKRKPICPGGAAGSGGGALGGGTWS
jgi:hypothetical protein